MCDDLIIGEREEIGCVECWFYSMVRGWCKRQVLNTDLLSGQVCAVFINCS